MAKQSKKVAADPIAIARNRMKGSRLSALLGFRIESVSSGRAVLTMDVRELHKQIHDVVHGGVLASLADTAAAVAAYSVVPEGTEIATVELKINYLSPVAGGRIRAEGKVLKAGRNFVAMECDICDAKGSLVAKALLTFGAAAGYSIERSGASRRK